MLKKGLLVMLEGIDGSGKTTTLRRIAQRSRESKLPFQFTCESGGTKLGRKIRRILLSPTVHIDKTTAAYLFASARSDSVRKVLVPELEHGDIVVCDRSIVSSLVYQGEYRKNVRSGRYEDANDILQLNSLALAPLRSIKDAYDSLLVFFDSSPKTVQQRMRARKAYKYDKYDQRTKSSLYIEHLRDKYLLAYRQWKGHKMMIDASLPSSERADMLWDEIMKMQN